MKLFIISIVQIVLSTLASLLALGIIKKMNSMWDDVANLVYNPVGPITFGIVVLIIAIIFEVKTNKQLKKENN